MWTFIHNLINYIHYCFNNLNIMLTGIALIPVLVFSQINFFIFIRIIKILMSKLRAHQMRYTDYKFRSDGALFLFLFLFLVVVVVVVFNHRQGRTNWRCWFYFFTLSEDVSLYFLYFSGLDGKTRDADCRSSLFCSSGSLWL